MALQLIICHLVLSVARKIIGPINHFLTEPLQDTGHAQLLDQLWLALSLINTNRRRCGESAERPHAADAIPRISLIRRFALALVSLQETRHEEFLRERG